MTTYRAQVNIDEGMLHTSRPILAPEVVRDLIDSVVYDVSQPERTGQVVSLELVIETPGESEHPIGDSIAGTSSTPLPTLAGDVDEDVDEPVGAVRS